MLFERALEALATAEPKMQKTAYYDNAALFGGYGGYGKADAYGYTSAPPQPYAQPALDTDYPGSACSLQGAAPIRAPPAHKSADLSGSCMRTGGGTQAAPPQPPGLGEQQQQPQAPPPALPSPSPPSSNPAHAVPAKKSKGGPNSSGSSSGTISKQIFPWMKESRQNSKQKNSCAPAGTSPTQPLWGRLGEEGVSHAPSPARTGSKIKTQKHPVTERAQGSWFPRSRSYCSLACLKTTLLHAALLTKNH